MADGFHSAKKWPSENHSIIISGNDSVDRHKLNDYERQWRANVF